MVDRSKSFREALIKSGLVNEARLKEVLNESRRRGETLIQGLLRKNVVDEEALINFLEKEMEIPRVDLSTYLIDPQIVKLIPLATAKKYHMIPLFKIGDVLTVAMVDPFNVVAIDEARSKTKCDIEPMVAATHDIEQAIGQYYGVAGSVADIVSEIEPEYAKAEEKAREEAPTLGAGDDAPISRLVNLIIARAVQMNASDVHLQPESKTFRVRYRVDGLLKDVSTSPMKMYTALVTRVKVMSRMNIAESRLPQDGRFLAKVEEKEIDARVSTFPTIYGESVVMRLLDKSSILLGLPELGFSKDNFKKFEKMVKVPYGIILVTGPTGSGKTTTLYATLNYVNSPEKNIMTVEDPVEYELQGVRQSQVNPKAGLDFANALRSMLRQDPDIMLVGEVRDLDTAKVAIQAAMTGHMVFSTLHTNDAAGAVSRLVEMGMEPFLVSSGLSAVIAQRLVRTLCNQCKEAYNPSDELLKQLGLAKDKKYSFYSPSAKGCKACNNTGYKGRTGIFEVLEADEHMRELVMKNSNADEIKRAAIEAGMTTLYKDALLKVIEGKTSVDEALRVTRLD